MHGSQGAMETSQNNGCLAIVQVLTYDVIVILEQIGSISVHKTWKKLLVGWLVGWLVVGFGVCACVYAFLCAPVPPRVVCMLIYDQSTSGYKDSPDLQAVLVDDIEVEGLIPHGVPASTFCCLGSELLATNFQDGIWIIPSDPFSILQILAILQGHSDHSGAECHDACCKGDCCRGQVRRALGLKN